MESITGTTIFDYLDSKNVWEEACKPEMKKKFFYSKACELVVEKGNISFNTALKRTIEGVQSEKFVSMEIEELKKRCLIDLGFYYCVYDKILNICIISKKR